MRTVSSSETAIPQFYRALRRAWGPQDWWPARSRFEVIVGAFLTQNTAWINVERALANLRKAGVLNLEGIRHLPLRRLQSLVRPAGYFRQKAWRLKNFVRFLDRRYGGSLQRMFRRPTDELRQELLQLNGVGPETADSILLYAGGHPSFVVDAYTRRILQRHGLLRQEASYEDARKLFHDALNGRAPELSFSEALPTAASPTGRRRHKLVLHKAPAVARIYDEYHALIVLAGKHHCQKSRPKCEGCPLEPFLDDRQR